MNTETICLADVQNNVVEIDSEYRMKFANTQRLILVVSASYPSKACYFEHPNIAARFNKVFECKHSRSSGHKWWTAHAGTEFYFVIPASKIQIIKEKGYSYIPFLLGGEKFYMNVSGGGGPGWTDWTSSDTVHICGIHATQKQLKLFAENAVLDQQVVIEQHSYNDSEQERLNEKERFNRLVANAIVQPKVAEGWKVYVGFDSNAGEGPFRVESRSLHKRSRTLAARHVEGSQQYLIRKHDIDGVRTAQANNFDICVATEFNKFPKLAA